MSDDTAATIAEKPPVAKGHRRVPNHVIEDIWQALSSMSRLRLPERKNQEKVVTLLRLHFDDPRKIYQDLKAKIIENHPVPEGWESETLPIGVSEARLHQMRELDDDTQDIKDVPKTLLITKDDLPKLIKGELGDQNQFGLGDIMHKLHFVYGGWPDTETIEDGEDGTAESEG